jgi:hypothetical protein
LSTFRSTMSVLDPILFTGCLSVCRFRSLLAKLPDAPLQWTISALVKLSFA